MFFLKSKHYGRSKHEETVRPFRALHRHQEGIDTTRWVERAFHAREQIQQRLRQQISQIWRTLQDGGETGEFYRDTRRLLKEAYAANFQAGLLAVGWHEPTTADDTRWLRTFSRHENRYLRRFAEDMRTSTGTMPYHRRMQMYLNTADAAYFAGQLAGLPHGTEIHWELSDVEHCDDCVTWAADGPYTADSLPAVPRDGTSACLSNCRCSLGFTFPARSVVAGRVTEGQAAPDVSPLRPPIGFPLQPALRVTEALALTDKEQRQEMNRLKTELGERTPGTSPYNLAALFMGGVLTALIHQRAHVGSPDVAIAQAYRDHGLLPLWDLYMPPEVWTVRLGKQRRTFLLYVRLLVSPFSQRFG